MTLARTPRYDADLVPARRGHAVVLGASMAGLLATRVLVDQFETVTLVEKDSLPDDPVARSGIPQSDHIHVMQKAGQVTLEDLIPGYGEELLSAGGLEIDIASDFKVYDKGGFVADGPNRLPMYCASRPLFEQLTRRRVTALEGVTVRDECQFVDYLVDSQGSTVEGVSVRTGQGEQEITADLVVDATGRTSRTPGWLTNHGYQTPRTDEVSIDVAYSTALFERPTDFNQALLVNPDHPRTRGCGAFPIEHGRQLVTLTGIHGDRPPTDPEGFFEYADSLPVPDDSYDITEQAMVTDDISFYPFPSNLRRRYEHLDRFPDGLVVIGDAIASFNPIYGQGMSVAALEAVQLHHTLGRNDREDLALEFFERAAHVVDDAWRVTVGSDFQFPQTTGPKPFATDLLNRYLSRFIRKSHTDGELADAFNRVVTMEKRPTSLFRPRLMWRTLTPG